MTSGTSTIKKPWYKKWWVWVIVAAVIVIGVIGNLVSDETSGDADATPTATQLAVAVPEVTGQDGASARDALTTAGLFVKFDSGDESVWNASNWMVESQAPEAGATVNDGDIVTLQVRKTTADPTTDPTTPDVALDEITAAQALAYAWEDRFPYGGTVHWVADRITTVNGDGTLTFKIGATFKNEYGTKVKATVEGDVGGTTEAPIILDSILYTVDGEIVNY